VKIPLALLATLLSPVVAFAAPNISGVWDVTLQGSIYDFEKEQHFPVAESATIIISQQVGPGFFGTLSYASDPEVFIPINGVIKGTKIIATTDGGVIEGSLSQFARGLYHRFNFTSIAPAKTGRQAAFVGTAKRK
jgi:hypothetical protein